MWKLALHREGEEKPFLIDEFKTQKEAEKRGKYLVKYVLGSTYLWAVYEED